MKKILLLLLTFVGMVSTVSADDTWTIVAGSTDIINGSNTWAPTETSNNMTKTGSVYTLTVTGKSLTKGTYEYKVAQNGEWDVTHPSSGNQSLIIPETATYTIVYTFNGSDNLTAAIIKTANGTSYTYKVSGAEALTGYDWETEEEEANMMSSDESVKVNYSLTLTGKTLTDGVEYGFKVLQDRNFETSWPSSNYNVIVHPSGTYDITFNFNVNTQTVTATAWCTDVRSIMGDFFDEGVWTTDKVMTQNPSNQNLYTLTIRGISLEAKTYNYKLRSNKAWGGYQLPGDETNKTYVCSSAGVYDLVFTANTSSHTLNLEATKIDDQSVSVSTASFATFVSPYDLDYTSASIKAYTAIVNTTNGKVLLSNISKVPANTPVILYKDGGATEDIPVATSTDTPGSNDLIAGTGSTVSTNGDGETYNYILNNGTYGIGFYKANDQIVATNRAYLNTTYDATAPGARMMMVFEEETTGIKEYNVKAISNRYFDLQGRSVAQPSKGLYIVNGKKVIKK